MKNDRCVKHFIPFEIAEGDGVDKHGFTKDESQQRVVYPEHMNVPTRIQLDPTRHTVQLSVDGPRAFITLVPLGVGEFNDLVLNHTTAIDGYRTVDKTFTIRNAELKAK